MKRHAVGVFKLGHIRVFAHGIALLARFLAEVFHDRLRWEKHMEPNAPRGGGVVAMLF